MPHQIMTLYLSAVAFSAWNLCCGETLGNIFPPLQQFSPCVHVVENAGQRSASFSGTSSLSSVLLCSALILRDVLVDLFESDWDSVTF